MHQAYIVCAGVILNGSVFDKMVRVDDNAKHMTGAKKLINAISSKLAASTHRTWPFEDTISVFWGEFRRPLAALDRCTLNKGAFAFKIFRGGSKMAT